MIQNETTLTGIGGRVSTTNRALCGLTNEKIKTTWPTDVTRLVVKLSAAITDIYDGVTVTDRLIHTITHEMVETTAATWVSGFILEQRTTTAGVERLTTTVDTSVQTIPMAQMSLESIVAYRDRVRCGRVSRRYVTNGHLVIISAASARAKLITLACSNRVAMV